MKQSVQSVTFLTTSWLCREMFLVGGSCPQCVIPIDWTLIHAHYFNDDWFDVVKTRNVQDFFIYDLHQQLTSILLYKVVQSYYLCYMNLLLLSSKQKISSFLPVKNYYTWRLLPKHISRINTVCKEIKCNALTKKVKVHKN